MPGRSSLPFTAHAAPIPAQAGVGLRFVHHDFVLSNPGVAAWLEVHPENYMGAGVAADILTTVRADYPISLHATGLSLGSASGVDMDHLEAIAALCSRIEPGLVSDHLSWSAAEGMHLPDLLPLPYTQEALAIFVRNVDVVQNKLRRPILIENPSVYLAFAHNEIDEAAFLAGVVRRTGCGILLDVNNIAVSAANLGEDPATRLNALLHALPSAAIGEIHLAGHAIKRLADGTEIHIDDHGSPVSDEVWALFRMAIGTIGACPALIEWDTDIPAFDALQGEAAKADMGMAAAAGGCNAAFG